MILVLDSSVTLAWMLEDETTPAIIRLFGTVEDDGAVVPALWRLEVANGLMMAERRGRLDRSRRQASLVDLGYYPIEVDPETDRRAWADTLDLADRLRLTVYDATYLELARRRGLPLATLDDQLREAAAALGIVTLGR